MAEEIPVGQPRWTRRPDAMGRWVVVAGLVLVAGAVITAGGPGMLRLPGRWYGLNEGRPIQADILYRGGLAVAASQRLGHQGLGVDPEAFLQAGIEYYETQGLRRDNPNPYAMYRLAVVYSQRGNPEEGVKLLGRLVQLDEERAPLYLAVSAVYAPEAAPGEALRNARAIIQTERDWVSRQVMVDLHVALGDKERARAAVEEEDRRAYLFGMLIGTVAIIYGLLGLVGAGVVARYLYLRVFREVAPERATPMVPGWSVLEACEVAATLVFAMVVAGVVSGRVTAWWDDAGGAQWVTATIVLVSYLGFCSAAVWVMRVRAGVALRDLPARIGLAERPRLRHAGAAVLGYAAMVAVVVALALTAHSAGMGSYPATESAMELLQQLESIPAAVIYFVLICVVAPVIEESIFRGFIYAGLRTRLTPPAAVFISAVVFGATHVRLAMGGMVAVACVGVLLALLYERQRTLWPSIIAHAAHNLLAFVILLCMNV